MTATVMHKMAGTEQDHRVRAMQRKMTRWSDAKLAKELHFALAAKTETHIETIDWFVACTRETEQRASAFA